MGRSIFLNKFLFMLYLIISSSIISVNTRIELSTNIDKFLYSFHESQNNLILLDDPVIKPKSRAAEKLLNFMLGMMVQIPNLRTYTLALTGLIDAIDKPQCTMGSFQEKYDSVKITQETIHMARQQETDELLHQLISDIGETEVIKSIDWSNPKQACKTVLELHHEKYSEIKESLKNTIRLSDFAIKVYDYKETFQEFYDKIGTGLTQLFHKERIRLKDFILTLNFNGNIEMMKRTYTENYAKWRISLSQLIRILKESEDASIEIQENFLNSKENLPDCSILPTTNEIQSEISNYVTQFIAGITVMKHVVECLGLDTMIFFSLLSFGVVQLTKLIIYLFGYVFAMVIQFALYLGQIGFYLYKGKTLDENTQFKDKYRYYGAAAGAFTNLLTAILGAN